MFLLGHPIVTKGADKYTMPTVLWIYLIALSLLLIVGMGVVLIEMLSGCHGAIGQLMGVLYLAELVAILVCSFPNDSKADSSVSPNV